jgi:hypothetical protein
MKKICDKCNEVMTLEIRPEIIFSIGRFSVLDMDHKELVCLDCEEAERKYQQDKVYDAIAEDAGKRGYERGLEEARL